MILAAGLGTRLRPLTDDIPKVLIPVRGIPILEIILRRLSYYGFNEVVINLHYKADLIKNFVRSHQNFGLKIHFSDETQQILDTGGGISNAGQYLNDGGSFLVHNGDIISNIDLGQVYEHHIKNRNMATLAVKDRESVRRLLFDNQRLFSGLENRGSGLKKMVIGKNALENHGFGFCGIYILNSDIFRHMLKGVYSIIDTLIDLAAGYRIEEYPVENNFWIDIGSHEQLKKAESVNPSVYLP